jgi:hypothetical protein
MINTTYENFEFMALQCFSEAAKLLRNDRFNGLLSRISLIESHKKSLEKVVSDLKNQGLATLVTAVISSTANLAGGLSGFAGPSGLGYFTNKTVSSLSKTLGAIGGTADAFGRAINSFQEANRYKDQASSDQIDRLIREFDRQIDDRSQTRRSIESGIESYINSSRDANRKIANM